MKEAQLTKPKTIFLDPKKILHMIGLRRDQRVADLGCGGGYFVLEAAREIGENGLAYGVDILPSALSAVASRARLYGLYNVRTVWANAEIHRGAKQIADHSVDAVLMIQLLSQSKKQPDIFKEASRIAKTDGTLLLVDWHAGHGYRFGPPAVNCINEEKIVALAAQYSWHAEKKFAAGPYHIGIIFKQ